jgi:hypothetical protein
VKHYASVTVYNLKPVINEKEKVGLKFNLRDLETKAHDVLYA